MDITKKDKFTNFEIVAISKNFKSMLRIFRAIILTLFVWIAIYMLLASIPDNENILLGMMIAGFGLGGWLTYQLAKAVNLPLRWVWCAGSLIPYVGGFVGICLLVIIGYRAAKALKLSGPWVYGACQVVPLVNLITICILYDKARAAIRLKGLKVGLMGVRKGELEKLAFNFSCSHCGQSIEAPYEMLETIVDCPSCNQKIQLSGAIAN